MPDSMDRLKQLADQKREQRPFAKLDKMEKELNLDDTPDTDHEDADITPNERKKRAALDEQAIIELAATRQAKFNNQAPL